MKRKATISLIEEISNGNRIDIKPNIVIDLTLVKDEYIKMFQKNEWYKSLIEADKTSYKSGNLLKYHYTFADGRQMVEEYNTDTDCLVRRAWKVKSRLGSEEWDVEIGDPIVLSLGPRECDLDGLKEGNNEPKLQRRNTRINLEWRIRNLPYPLQTYDVTVNKIDRCIVVKTSNKKYFKKLIIPELDRLNIPLDQGNLHISHAFNTLVILYNKPKDVMEMERKWLEELKKVKPTADQVPADCKPF